MPARLFRVILPVTDIDAAAHFYGAVLGEPGERVSINRHYFGKGAGGRSLQHDPGCSPPGGAIHRSHAKTKACRSRSLKDGP